MYLPVLSQAFLVCSPLLSLVSGLHIPSLQLSKRKKIYIELLLGCNTLDRDTVQSPVYKTYSKTHEPFRYYGARNRP